MKYFNPSVTLQVKKWNAVALWAWDILVDNCAICRNHIMDLCIECQANQASHTSDVSFRGLAVKSLFETVQAFSLLSEIDSSV